MRIIREYAGADMQGESATVAQVSYADSGGFGAIGAGEQRGIPVFAPRGIAYRPCEGDNLLLIPADGAMTCAGVLSTGDSLAPGELRLSSSGGASIRLMANGEIDLNGLRITKDGQITQKGGG